jgi:hypothetical protein
MIFPFTTSARAADKKPNVILMLADNVGYGDLGCYGGGEIRGAPLGLATHYPDPALSCLGLACRCTRLKHRTD